MLFCLRYWVSIACDSLVVGVMLFILFRRKVWFVLLNTCCLCNTSKHEHAHATHVSAIVCLGDDPGNNIDCTRKTCWSNGCRGGGLESFPSLTTWTFCRGLQLLQACGMLVSVLMEDRLVRQSKFPNQCVFVWLAFVVAFDTWPYVFTVFWSGICPFVSVFASCSMINWTMLSLIKTAKLLLHVWVYF